MIFWLIGSALFAYRTVSTKFLKTIDRLHWCWTNFEIVANITTLALT